MAGAVEQWRKAPSAYVFFFSFFKKEVILHLFKNIFFLIFGVRVWWRPLPRPSSQAGEEGIRLRCRLPAPRAVLAIRQLPAMIPAHMGSGSSTGSTPAASCLPFCLAPCGMADAG